MATSFINVVQVSPRTPSLEPIRWPRSRPFGFKLRGRLVPALKSRTTLPSSVRPGLPSANTRSLGGQPSPPKTQDSGCRPRCDFYRPSLLPRPERPSSSLVFITSAVCPLPQAKWRKKNSDCYVPQSPLVCHRNERRAWQTCFHLSACCN